jgi:hypothetical protein
MGVLFARSNSMRHAVALASSLNQRNRMGNYKPSHDIQSGHSEMQLKVQKRKRWQVFSVNISKIMCATKLGVLFLKTRHTL